MASKKTKKIEIRIEKKSSEKGCMSCGCPCWRSDVSYCWDCYKYQMFESR